MGFRSDYGFIMGMYVCMYFVHVRVTTLDTVKPTDPPFIKSKWIHVFLFSLVLIKHITHLTHRGCCNLRCKSFFL